MSFPKSPADDWPLPGHDPVDMIKTEPDEASVAAAPITAMILSSQAALQRSSSAQPGDSSWAITEQTQRAQAYAQLAQAQASYAIYLELCKITEALQRLPDEMA